MSKQRSISSEQLLYILMNKREEENQKKGIIKKDGTNIENIPFKETNNYVRKILRDYKMYKKIYEK